MDLTNTSIAVGLIVSLLFSELFGLAAGGMVVPGYVAVFLHKPLSIVLTIAAAVATYGLVRLLSRYVILYGKRKTLLMILVGFLVGCAIRAVPFGCVENVASIGGVACDCSVIGFIIPGLVAIWIDRQGLLITISALLTSAVVVRLVLILCIANI